MIYDKIMKLKTEIKRYLERTGLKPYQLADLANITRSSLYRYLNNEQDIFLSIAEKIKKVIRIGK